MRNAVDGAALRNDVGAAVVAIDGHDGITGQILFVDADGYRIVLLTVRRENERIIHENAVGVRAVRTAALLGLRTASRARGMGMRTMR